jgi:hypothetical protein
MGFNTTVIVMNDALHEIREDPEFGRKLSEAIAAFSHRNPHLRDVSAGCHVNAAHVIETHHADGVAVVAVGGNTGVYLGYGGGWGNMRSGEEEKILQALADSLGYELKKKRKKG